MCLTFRCIFFYQQKVFKMLITFSIFSWRIEGFLRIFATAFASVIIGLRGGEKHLVFTI